MTINNPRQLKDWINNMAKKNNLESKDVLEIWNSYKEKYPYAEGIEFSEIFKTPRGLLDE